MTRLPPGSDGLPLIGETLTFIRDTFGFMRTRFEKHGPVFRTHLLGSPMVFITGAELTDTWLDESKIQREGSFPKNVLALFGGQSLPTLDGPTHRIRKRIILSAFKRNALASYVSKLDEAVLASLERAFQARELEWLPELKRLAIDGILRSIFGMDPGPDMDGILADYRAVTAGFSGLPINLPGTKFHAGLKAKDRVLTRLRALVDEHVASPKEDGLSILLATEIEGHRIAGDDLVLELHHMILAGLIIFAEFGCSIMALADHPEIHEKLLAEVGSGVPASARGGERRPLTFERLEAMPYLERVVLETKRACPNVPLSFGRARETFSIGGYEVPKGHFVLMSVHANNLDPKMFPSPETFDPDRFAAGRAEHERHPHAYQPQGAGKPEGHQCAGVDFSTVFMKVFLARLVERASFSLPEQDLSLRWNIVPPEPHDGLLARVRRRESPPDSRP
jgi:cytochrome P450